MQYSFFLAVIFMISTVLLGCNNKNKQSLSVEITGAYAAERQGVETHAFSDKVLGNFFIRDTIFIKQIATGYEISNRRWRKTDYDTMGWRRIYENAIKTHTATFDKTDSALRSELSLYPPMYLDLENKQLYRSSKRNNPYVKVPN
ncbi:MAG: hypothetical protein ACTHMM_04965 [Agriterribacter sp.]